LRSLRFCHPRDRSTQSNVRFIHFTENDGEFLVSKIHRIVSARKDWLLELSGDGSNDEAGGVYDTYFQPRIDEFIQSAADEAFEGVDIRERVAHMHTVAYEYFASKTSFWFENPMLLPFWMLDEKGEAVRGAKALVELAGDQGPLVTFPPIIAKFLHEGITAQDVLEAIRYPASTSLAVIFLPATWPLVVKLSEMDEDHGYDPSTVRLRDEPELSELYSILARHGRHLPIGSSFEETVVKTVQKVLHHTHRQNDEIATRKTSALHRDPKRLYKATEALLSLASKTIGTHKRDRKKPRKAAPDVRDLVSIHWPVVCLCYLRSRSSTGSNPVSAGPCAWVAAETVKCFRGGRG
jgi:hypothetical protein